MRPVHILTHSPRKTRPMNTIHDHQIQFPALFQILPFPGKKGKMPQLPDGDCTWNPISILPRPTLTFSFRKSK